MASSPTVGQLRALEITERTTSALSLLGTFAIIITFCISKEFHKSINRLVVYASVGNIISNIATLISVSGVEAGGDSAVCQAQGFIIQLFMPADALWTLAMACNVYLTFFKKYDERQLRALEWKYFMGCYTIPAIPAFVFLFVKSTSRGKVYGPAVLWCWISKEWDVLRLAVFYGPVWIVILATMTIYIIAGLEIFQKRRALRSFALASPATPTSSAAYPPRPRPENPTKTTEVQVTSEAVPPATAVLVGAAPRPGSERASNSHTFQVYSVNIESVGEGHLSPGSRPRLHRRPSAFENNAAAWGYTRCAFFFFMAMLVTWVPSSVNRVYGLLHPTTFSFSLNYLSALVLPLQGFWNAVIYFSTSLPACLALWRQLRGHAPPPSSSPLHGGLGKGMGRRRRRTMSYGMLDAHHPAERVSQHEEERESKSASLTSEV
ncbi:MAG: hypothetical protein M1832_002192 [Thelocarpon impressellum]|nr:MAG: hypothetical protein M1832_002192 [Thelocarpon impressellum]